MKQNIKERIEKIRNGEVPEGYKETKVGIIPNDWDSHKLSKLGFFKNGINKDKKYFGHGNPLISLNDVFGKKVLHSDDHFESLVNCSKDEINNYDLKDGDVLFVRSSVKPEGVGLTAIIDTDIENTVYSGFIIRYRMTAKLIKNFRKYAFDGFYFRKNMLRKSTISANTNVSQDILNSLEIISPSEPEQEKIAEILSTWDKAIELKEKLIEEKKEFKKGLMQNLLTGEIRFPEFTGDWEEKKLGDIFSERKEVNQNGSELLSITSSKGVIKRSEIEGKDNSSKDKSKYKKICRGDIGYNTMRMWQGVSAVSEYEGIVSPAYTIVKIKEDVDIYYFGYLFKLRKIIDLFWRYSQGLVNDTLNLKYENFKIIKITVPTSKVEQEKISATLKSIDIEISSIKAEKELLGKQKRGLMQLLLTGIVRVEVN